MTKETEETHMIEEIHVWKYQKMKSRTIQLAQQKKQTCSKA